MYFSSKMPVPFLGIALIAVIQAAVWADGQSSQTNTKQPTDSSASNRDLRGSTFKNDQGIPTTFTETDLEKVSFQSVKTWASFSKASLREAILKESSFVGVDFRDANLEMARFIQCVLPAARFIGAKCNRINFQNCSDICGVDFSDTSLEMARFVNCSAPAARFVGANCCRINFQNCSSLCAADFRDANLEMARFANCRLPAASFVGANCNRISFRNCTDVCAADFSDASLGTAVFSHCSLPAAKFSGAQCKQAIFRNCSLTSGADFIDADLELATFSYCQCSYARFAGSNLKATTFRNCDLTGADFRDVVFSEGSLIDPVLRGADLRGADLSSALQGGEFNSKTIYDKATKFPQGFDPVAKGLTLK